MEQAGTNSLAAGLEHPAVLHTVQLMGDDMFITPEVEDLAKDLQAIEEDVQVDKASTPSNQKKRLHTSFMFPS